MAVNDSGDAVGTGYRFGGANQNQSAFLFQANGTVAYLGGLGASLPNNAARAVNDSDVIVGDAETSSSAYHAFVWSPGSGSMQDLNNLLASGSGTGWNLQYAYGVNNSGHIVGYGTIGQSTRSFDAGANARAFDRPAGAGRPGWSAGLRMAKTEIVEPVVQWKNVEPCDRASPLAGRRLPVGLCDPLDRQLI